MVALISIFASFALAAPAVIAGRVVARANLVARQFDGGAAPEIPPACVDTCSVFTQTMTGDCADVSCLCTQTVATGIADCLRCAVKYVDTADFNESVATATINGFVGECNAEGFPITLDGVTATTGTTTATSDLPDATGTANSTTGSATGTSTTLSSTSGTTSQTATRSTSTSSKVTESQTAPSTTGTTQSSAGSAHTLSVMGSVAAAAMAGLVLL